MAVVVETGSVTNVTTAAADFVGAVQLDGETLRTYRFVWNTAGNPTLTANVVTATGADPEVFFSGHGTGLPPGTTVHVRAVVETGNSLPFVVTYGNEISFTTLSNEAAIINTGGVVFDTSNLPFDAMGDRGVEF